MELSSSKRENIRHLKAEKIATSLEIKLTKEKLKQLLHKLEELDQKLKLEKNEGAKEISILDIPVLVWQKITALTSDSDEHLINQCLASPVLDDIITKSRFVGRKEYLIADKVFSILVQNQYLDKNDLHNCASLNARNDAFEMAALRTWRFCSKNGMEEDEAFTVTFRTEDEMLLFERNVDSHANNSKMFIGKTLEFSWRSSSNTENSTYWQHAKRIVRKYKKYILQVSMNNTDDDHGIALGLQFSCFCLRTLDRLQMLFCHDWMFEMGQKLQLDHTALLEMIDSRTRRRYFEIDTDEPCVYKNPLFKMVAPTLELWVLSCAKPNTGDINFGKLKTFRVQLKRPVTCGEFLKCESLRGLERLEKLEFAYLPLANFKDSEIPTWIEPVTDLRLSVFNLKYQKFVSWGPWKPALPNVKKLTLSFCSDTTEYYPPLAPFVASMKSLKVIILKASYAKQQLSAALQQCFDQGLIEDDADIYELYGKGRSHIWKMASGLNCVTVNTQIYVATQEWRNIEKYTRSGLAGNVDLKEYQSPTTKH